MEPANRAMLDYGDPMRFLSLVVLLAACKGGAATSTDTASPPPTGDPVVPPIGTDEGTLTLVRGFEGGELVRSELVGVFASDLQDYLNVGACILDDLTPCLTDLPAAEGEQRPYDLLDRYVETQSSYRYLGLAVSFGPFETYYQVDEVISWYYADVAEQGPLGGPADVSLAVEWGEHELPAAVTIPDGLIVTSPPQGETLRAYSDDTDFEITWEPQGAAEMYLFVQTDDESDLGRVFRVDDDGSYTLDLTDLGLFEDALLDIQLARWTRETVDLDGNELQLLVTDEADFLVEYVPVGGRVPVVPSPDCETAEVLPEGRYYADLDGYPNSFEVLECLQSLELSDGRDAVFLVDIPPRHRMTLELRQLQANGALYLLETCDPFEPVCTDGADRGFGLQTETLTRFNPSADQPEQLTVVVDGIGASQGGLFFLDHTETSVPEPDVADTCSDAATLPLLQPGQYYLGSPEAFSNALNPGFDGCTTRGQAGSDFTARIEVPAFSTLDFGVDLPGSSPSIYLTEDCTDLDTCLIAADGSIDGIELLTWQNTSGRDREVYVTVDSTDGIGSGFVTMTITP